MAQGFSPASQECFLSDTGDEEHAHQRPAAAEAVHAVGQSHPQRAPRAAAPAIMPTIITAHMANVKKPSAAVHGTSGVIPIAAIIMSCCLADDI